MVGFAVIWVFTSFGHGYKNFFVRSFLVGGIGFVAISSVSVASNYVSKEIDRVRLDMHRSRAENFSPPTPESVEWLNSFIKVIWGLIPPDTFVPIADQIEDVMQQSLPGFVSSVKIADIGQGTNPFRIISMRALPDQPKDPKYPRKHWIKGKEENDPEDVKEESLKHGKEHNDKLEAKDKPVEEEDSGDYVVSPYMRFVQLKY
jgi:Ca2+-dependent lipid-binding protein